MIAVIFEVYPKEAETDNYFQTAAELRPILEQIDGFLSVERFRSLADPGKILSLSFFDNEDAVQRWRQSEDHREAQRAGRDRVFADYRLRVAAVVRDYSMRDRRETPPDSLAHHEGAPQSGQAGEAA